MIIQDLLFPSIETCDRESMYYRQSKNSFFIFRERFYRFEASGELQSDTYFNSFSIGKWKKYTILDSLYLTLRLKGRFLIKIHHVSRINKNNIVRVINEVRVCHAETQTIRISVPIHEKTGLYYFSLLAEETGAEFWGGYYETDIDESTLPDVKIAIGICTFRREEYVARNINILRKNIIEDERSPLFQRLEVFISDNGKTLPQSLNSEHIRIFPNKNLGGAGGFTRAMIEVMKLRDTLGITHILLMDDDVLIDYHSIVRTFMILRLLKKKMREAFVGGAMLRLDNKNIQNEAADHWDMVSHHPVKYNYNLENIDMLLKNEVEDTINHFGWWYCCMPVGVIRSDNLPLPIFIKRDDIEYGLRNGTTFIMMNGICVWHEPFQFKSTSYLEYYYFRNMCVLNSRHRTSFTRKRLIKTLTRNVLRALMSYRYREAELAMIGLRHYLKGVDWLKSQDAEKLNTAVMKLAYKKVPVDNLDYVFIHGSFENNLAYKESRLKHWVRKLTLNGWLLPAKRSIVVTAYKPPMGHFFRASRVLNYEDATGMGFITEKNYGHFLYVLKFYLGTVRLIIKDYDRVTREYRARFNELTNLGFWNEYLNRDGPEVVLHSGLQMPYAPRNKFKDFVHLAEAWLLRVLQRVLFFAPVKKNRVMFYVHERKGFTCNPKYIVLKLRELYGEKVEIIWASLYPESCDELRDLGIKVIYAGSAEYLRTYLTTHVFITNDSFPAWAVRRYKQQWINTWHAGMNYKHIGYDYLAPMSWSRKRLFRLKNRQPSYFLSGSQFFTDDTSKSFHMDKGVFIPTGLPRNDIMRSFDAALVDKVRKKCGLSEDVKIVLFAPTFRRGMKSTTYGLDFSALIGSLEQRFGGEWVVLFRNHNFVKNKQTYSFPSVVDVSDYEDMQELMCAADVLVTDYSSCMWDFAITGRPCFVFAPDLEQYKNSDRAFAYPTEKWPYAIARNNTELQTNITGFDESDYKERLNRHSKEVGSFDRGDAAQRVAELLGKICL